MASVITATNSSGLTTSADNSGVLQLASGTGNLVTIPSVTGTAMVSGNMPAFYAYASTNQAISQSVFTKVTLGSELFDTNNNFASSRFTPTVAGYYQINAGINFGGNATVTYGILCFFKNGSEYNRASSIQATNVLSLNGASLIYLNGSTDYVELYAYSGQANTSLYSDNTPTFTYFNGSLVRSA